MANKKELDGENFSSAETGATKKAKDEKTNVHAGHRSRMKATVREKGLDTLNEHQALEVLLFYSIPQRDTNPLAHELINHFGSFASVLDAKYEDLMSMSGVSDNTATLLKMIPQLSRLYMLSKGEKKRAFSSKEEIGTYLTNYYIGVQVEKPILLLLNDQNELIVDPIVLSSGTETAAIFDIKTIASYVALYKASKVLLAHNHPGCSADPSANDIEITQMCRSSLALLGVMEFIHIIVGKNSYSTSSDWNI